MSERSNQLLLKRVTKLTKTEFKARYKEALTYLTTQDSNFPTLLKKLGLKDS